MPAIAEIARTDFSTWAKTAVKSPDGWRQDRTLGAVPGRLFLYRPSPSQPFRGVYLQIEPLASGQTGVAYGTYDASLGDISDAEFAPAWVSRADTFHCAKKLAADYGLGPIREMFFHRPI